MICSPANLFFSSNLLSSGLDYRFSRYSNPGERRLDEKRMKLILADD